MNIISSLFGRIRGNTDSPWTDESIYRLIESHIDSETGKLTTDDLALPDEQEVQGDSRVRWAAGAMDGVATYHMGNQKEKTKAKRVAKLIEEVARNGDKRAEAALVPLLEDETVFTIVDDVLEQLVASQIPTEPHLTAFAISLATRTKDRGAVKLGLALLGVLANSEHEQIVQALGKHDEFTLYAAVALSNMFEDASAPMWNLAKSVDGWGRIQVVERLVPTDEPEIQKWLRLEGFRNSVMYEYLTHSAAVHGRLREALSRQSVEKLELVAASEILAGLITGNGSPALGIDDYDEAAETYSHYFRHVVRNEPEIQYFLTAHLLLDYLENDERDSGEKLKNGWTESMRKSIEETTTHFLAEDHWIDLAMSGLKSENDQQFYEANQAANYLKLDVFEHHWERLNAKPEDGARWFNVMKSANAERIQRVVELAEASIPLDEIATGPAEDLGLGMEYSHHGCLDFVLQDLGEYPGYGWRLIEAGLKSPVIRNRNMALNALEAWGKDKWPAEVSNSLASAVAIEPQEDVRNRMQELIAD